MSKIIKSILFIFITIFWTFFFLKNTSFADMSETSFIVTAYYSPLPNQKHYITWSYAWDIRLNWKWHTTASWKPVKQWILAAPTKYPFWTKIYFNGYGIWTVEDRWWAIVKAWIRWYEHDRIDIWVWHGDEWLMRARKWWKRSIKWIVVSRSSEISLKFSDNVLTDIENIKVNPENHSNIDVKKLQQNFKKLWLYNWEIDGSYQSIKWDLIDFQIKNKVIRSKTQIDAWWFWPKTYLTLIKKYWSKDILVKQENTKIVGTNEKVKIILDHEEIKLNWDKPDKAEIKKVQSLFIKLWMYNWKIDWDFNSIKRILLDFQKESWIIKKDNSWWAWYFWEKTKAALITHFEKNEKNRKKKITIDDISYDTLKKIWEKIKNSKKSDELIKKLKKVKTKLKRKSQIKKIDYLIKILE